jgi:hypothetical protein
MRKIVQLSAVTVFGALCFAVCAAGSTSSGGGVVGVLQKKYLVTQMTPDHEQITKDGTTMLMKAAGVYSDNDDDGAGQQGRGWQHRRIADP